MLYKGWGDTEPSKFFDKPPPTVQTKPLPTVQTKPPPTVQTKPPPTVQTNPLREVNQDVVSTDTCKKAFNETVKFTILKKLV